MRKKWFRFLVINGCFLLGALMMFPYRLLCNTVLKHMVMCGMKDLLHLYCPFCGATRALDSLLHLRVADAFRYNAPITALVFIIAFFDIVAFFCLILKKKRVFYANIYWLYGFIAVLGIYFVARNVLLVLGAVDFPGELIKYYT